jgi:hypothetical protein
MKISFLNKTRIIIVALLISSVIFINLKYQKIENSNRNEFIQSETSFVVDSIERLSICVLIHLYDKDTSFYEYMPYLPLYDFVEHRDSVVKRSNTNGFYIFKYKHDYKLHIFIKGYE